jgi:hypothetical protein
VQFTLLCQKAKRDILWGYPTAFDQSTYLLQTYKLHETINAEGLAAGLRHWILAEAPTGALQILQGAVSMFFINSPRLACLSVNFSYFLLAQIFLAYAFYRKTGTKKASVVAVGVFLSTSFPFYWAGGVLDYRLDNVATCLFTMFISSVILSDFFRKRRWSIIAGILGGLLMIARFLSATYLVAITIISLFILGIIYIKAKNKVGAVGVAKLTRSQIVNVLLAGSLSGLCFLPFLIINISAIYNYYGVGHVLGVEKLIRINELNIKNQADHLLFYIKSLYKDHLGLVATLLLGVSCFGATLNLIRKYQKSKSLAKTDINTKSGTFDLIFIIICFVAPFVILTLHSVKSPVVASVLVPPIVIITTYGLIEIFRKEYSHSKLSLIIATSTIIIGSLVFFGKICRKDGHSCHPEFTLSIEKTYAEIQFVLNANKIDKFTIAFTCTNEALIPGAFTVRQYEKTRKLLSPKGVLGGTIFAMSWNDIRSKIEQADIIILYKSTEKNIFPFQDSIIENWEGIKSFCETNTRNAGVVQSPLGEIIIYCTRQLNATNGSDQ